MRTRYTLALLTIGLVALSVPASGQNRFLGKADITVYGLGLKVEPPVQTVPKGFATIVSTFLQGSADPNAVPPFAPDAEVRATLRGPSFAQPIDLVAKPNSPFNIPLLTVAGTHTLENIRLVSGGEVVLYGSPETARIEVIDKLLVTTVVARPLTAEEIREKGIVFDKDNFQAYNFTAAFAIDDGSKIDIQFPVVLPTLASPKDVGQTVTTLEGIDVPALRGLQTIIPDTLRIQARIPNLSVVGFTLTLDSGPAASQNFYVPPIPGVIVIPGDIGFLNQFFSVMLMVANVAPEGSNLVVSELTASIVLPPGKDSVVGSNDDPLAMARRAGGETPRIVPVTRPGPDGVLGNGDDLTTLGPQQTGNAEFLVEGRREGTHVVEMELAGTLNGLPIGPVPVRGRAAGAVLVRNPTFTLTFTHPDVVNVGEPYTLDVTVTNTSESPANFVSINLFPPNISGARLDDEPSKAIESIAPGDSASVTYRLISNRTGKVTAATLDSDENVAGRFQLKTAIGELGVPLSPDSLVLPQEANALPAELRAAALGLLGRAWAVATAPPAALPKDLTRFSKQVVLDRGVQTAEGGFRLTLGEPLPSVASSLWMDYLGSEYRDLAQRVPAGDTTGLLGILQKDLQGFDLVRRRSVRGDVFADAIARILRQQFLAAPATFHSTLAEQYTSRPSHVSILLSAGGAALPVDGILIDAAGRRTGGADGARIAKEIPFSDVLTITGDDGLVIAQLLVVAVPDVGEYTVRLARRPGQPADAPYDVSVAYPTATGGLRFAAIAGVGPAELPAVQHAADDPSTIRFQLSAGGNPVARSAASAPVLDPPPTVLGARQMSQADIVGCTADELGRVFPAGRVIAVLFSEKVTPESVQDKLSAAQITSFLAENNRVVGVALQPGGRVAYLALREPIGPFIQRTLTVDGVKDRSGQAMAAAQSLTIVATVSADLGGLVSGRVLNADGTPAAFASVRMFYEFGCFGDIVVQGIAEETTDAAGRYAFDYVLAAPGMTVKLAAIETERDELRILKFKLARPGQHLNVDVVLLGRGTLRGRTLAEDGTPLAGTALRITSATDQSQYAATSAADGTFEVGRIPVGNVLIEAVNVTRGAQIFVSEHLPFAGAVVSRDITLLDVDTTQVDHKKGSASGRVVRSDGVTAVASVPVIAYYKNRSQIGLACPTPPGGSHEPSECALAVATTDSNGLFRFPSLPAGEIRLNTFDQVELMEGNVRVAIAENQNSDATILLAGGVGTVKGVVLDASGHFVPDAVVGGGLSLANVNPADGTFTLTDVPIGRRKIVAVSEALETTGEATVDIVQQGEVVNATVVLQPIGAIAGIVRNRAGVPQAGIKVWVFTECFDEFEQASICVRGEDVSDQNGAYRIDGLPVGRYTVSAFQSDMKDGNLNEFAVRFNRQVVINDITFRGGFGTVRGRVLRACASPPCADTPLPAKVAISGDRLTVAGGKVGVKFEYVQNFAIDDNDFTTGEYEFRNIWTGPFTVRAAGQFSPEPVAVEGTIPAPGATVTVDIRLLPTSRVTGTVYESDGFTPVTNRQISVNYKSNAVVVFCSEDEFGFEECKSIPQGIQEYPTATDAQGRFSFLTVSAGPFTITAADPTTGKIGEVQGSVRAGDTVDMNVRLLGRADVTVRVFRSDGSTPVPGATVLLQQISYPKAERTGAAVNGTVTFGGGDALSEGQFVITATGPGGFAGRAAGRVSTDGTPVTVDVFIFDATGTVTGQVFRETAGGLVNVPNAEVILSTTAGPIAFAVSDATGAFSIPLVPTGNFTIEAFDAATAARGRATGTVFSTNEPTAVSVRLEPLGSIRGTVVESNGRTPLKGWTVTLTQVTPAGRSLPQQIAQTGVDGSFTFPGSSIGTFHLRASQRNVVGQGSASGTISLGGQVVEVPLVVNIERRVTGKVTGLVANPNGQPAPSAQVEVCGSGDPCRATTSGNDGKFSLDDVPLGRFTVRASAQVSGNPSVGTTGGTVLFDGDTADVTVTLLGLSVIEGTVYELVNGNRVPAANATVRLHGQPGSGCPGACQKNTDPNGRFQFINVPAQTFTVSATAFSGQQGSVGGSLIAGETKSGLEIVLAPAVSLRARVLTGDGRAAGGVVAELKIGGGTLFAETDATGVFVFDAVSAGAYTLLLQDPVGGGIAKRVGNIVVVAGAIDLGDVTLDEAPPMVSASTPDNGATGISRTTEIRMTFSERVNAATVNSNTLTLVGPDGAVGGQVDTLENDTVGRFRLLPGVQLAELTRYSIRVSGVTDLAGRAMLGNYVASFTTLDLTPPAIVETTPGDAASGVTIDTTIRVKYSEIVDPARFAGPAIVLTGPSGPVAGRIDFAFSNTLAIFTPDRPLAEDTQYSVRVARATDLTGRQQAADTQFQFATTDRTPPLVTALVASNNGRVIEGSVAQVTASVTPSDVSVVDFFINDVFAFADRAAPFALMLQAAPQFGGPGSRIKVSAVAVDTSGNRGVGPVHAFVDVIADQAPAVAIAQPAAEITAPAGQRVDVQVQATDDVALTQIAYLVRGTGVVDAATRAVVPAATARSESFSFLVPIGALPGSVLTIEASAVDNAGHTTQAAARTVRVLDSVGPTVQIAGLSSGQRVRPGQEVTAVVQAADPGLLAKVGLEITGVLTRTDQRDITPARASVATTFVFTVPANATSADVVTLRAFAIDAAGNRGNSAQTTLPIADQTIPTVTVRTADGSNTIPAGRAADIVVEATDDVALANLRLSATGPGGFAFDDTRAVPPVSPASVTFSVLIPDTLAHGDQIAFTARATDASGNDSVPTTLTVTVRQVDTVTLPLSVSLDAGAVQTIAVTLGAPAPAGGTVVNLTSRAPGIATVTASVQIPAGSTSADAVITGIKGGTTQVDAFIGGVVRQTMTVTVAGGIVRGTVLKMVNSQLMPVADAQVTAFHGNAPLVTTSAADGTFAFAGVSGGGLQGRDFSIRATDGTLLGFVDAQLTVAGGSADVTVVLIAAGSIDGIVTLADGTTRVGEGVKVELFEAANPNLVIATTFTDSAGQWLFPLVAPGPYRLEAADQAGNRARADAVVVSGASSTVPLVFLGRGTVTGIVKSGAGAIVPNAQVELRASSIFGSAPIVTGVTGNDGRFSFTNVYLGSATVTAKDLTTNQAGTANGLLETNGGTLDLTVTLSSYANLRGTVKRADGVTLAPAAQVTVRLASGAQFSTQTAQDGTYQFTFLPLQPTYTVTVRDPGTRGLGIAQGGFTQSGETATTDVTLLPQGALLVTVLDANGAPVNGATVSARIDAFSLVDTLQGVTTTVDGNSGRLLLDKLLAGPFVVTATAAGLDGRVTGTLVADQVTPVTVTLEPTGIIQGDVLDQDGQSPAAGTVRVYANGGVAATAPLVNGRYSVSLRLGSYALDVIDTSSRRRALSGTLTLASNGEVIEHDMTFVALGTVSGRVIHAVPGGSVGNLTVQVRSLHPVFGGFFNDQTDAAGNYSVSGVPVGPITATSTKSSEQLIGEASGLLSYTPPVPAELSLDIQLRTNAVNLPAGLVDGNGTTYSVGAGGGIVASTAGTFSADGGGLVLDLTPSGGAAQRFTGAGFGTFEDGNREIAVRQNAVAGLNVTRKVYVPTTGYFTRYLEILTNPTGQPISVDVLLSSRVYGGRNQFCSFQCERTLFLSTTSSGDSTIAAGGATPDRWFTLGGFGDGYANFNDALSVNFVFDGDGGALQASSAAYTQTNPNVSPFLRPLVTVGWQSVMVPAGQSVALMHFVSLQNLATAATASGQRLVQLPPEALDGLSADEIAWIRNFNVPGNGVSALEPLPAITGAVSGRVLEGDASTVVPNTTVTFQSSVPVYPRRLSFGVNASGQFSFSGAPGAPIPLAPFTLSARHPANQFRNSPTMTAEFDAGQASATEDVVFTDGGILKGVVRRTNGVPVAGAQVEVVGYTTTTTDTNGRYFIGGVSAGNPTVRGTVPRSQGDGSSLALQQQTFALAAGQVRDDIVLVEAAGTVTGVLTNGLGQPQGNRTVTFTHADGTFQRTAQTGAADGRFTFTDLRAGAGTLRTVNPANNFPVTKAVVVTDNGLADGSLAYQGNITLTVLVTRANNAPLPGMSVTAAGTGFSVTGSTDAQGIASLANVPLGQVTTVTATHPSLASVLRAQTSFTSAPNTPQVTLALPAFGTVSGEVSRPNGSLAGFGVPVSISGSTPTFSFSAVNSDNSSRYAFTAVPVGQSFTLTVRHPSTTVNGSFPTVTYTGTVSADNQVVTLNPHYPAIAQLTITVTENGSPLASAPIQESLSSSSNPQRGTTNASGQLVLTQVSEGTHTYRVIRPATSSVIETAAVSITAANDGGSVSLPIAVKKFTVSVKGTVLDADGAPMANPQSVTLLRAGDRVTLASTCIGGPTCAGKPTGEFTFTNFDATNPIVNSGAGISTGAGLIVQVRSPFLPFEWPTYEQLVVPNANGQYTVTINMPFRRATIHGRVLTTGGTAPVGAGAVSLHRVADTTTAINSAPSVAADGTWSHGTQYFPAEGVRAKLWSVTGLDNGIVQAVSGPIATPNQDISIDLVLPAATLFTKVRGKVTAGDGVTLLDGANISMTTPKGNCCSAGTNQLGEFELSAVLATDGQFTLTATAPIGNSPAVTQSFTATEQGGTVDVGTLVVPVSMLTGTVTFGPTVPASDVTVIVRAANGQNVAFLSTDSDGKFRMFGLTPGTYTLIAQHYQTGYSAETAVTIDNAASSANANIELPPVGTVVVRVFDKSGAPVEPTRVALTLPGSNFVQYCSVDDNVYPSGNACTFEFVPPGGYYAQAQLTTCDEDGDNCSSPIIASGSGTLVDAGTTKTIDIRFDKLGTVSWKTDPNWVNFGWISPGERIRVTIRAFGANGVLGTYDYSTMITATSQAQTFTFDDVPPGTVVMLAEKWHPDGQPVGSLARVTGVLSPNHNGTPLALDFAHGLSNVDFWVSLRGTDNWIYWMDDTGAMPYGARYVDPDLLFGNGFYRLNDMRVFYDQAIRDARVPSFRTLAGGQEATVGPFATKTPVHVTRRMWVPESGGFARYLDVFTNDSAVPVLIDAELYSDTEGIGRVETLPSATTGASLVYAENGGDRAVLGLAYAGIDAPVKPSLFYDGFDDNIWFDRPRVRTTFTVPANGSATLMHFVALREPGDTAGVTAQTAALVTLSEPNALVGLTTQDFANIINYRFSKIRGKLLGSDGVTPLRAARVELKVAGTTCAGCVVTTDNNGSFEIVTALPPGALALTVTPTVQNATPIAVPLGAPVNGVIDTGSVSVQTSVVRGRVTFGPDTAATSTVVKAVAAGVTVASTITNGLGGYSFVGLAPGSYEIQASHALSGFAQSAPATISAAGEVVVVDIALPPANTVVVSVWNQDGIKVRPGRVALSTPAGSYQVTCGSGQAVSINAQNDCRFTLVPSGVFHAQAEITFCENNVCRLSPAFATGELNGPGATLQLDVTFEQHGTVEVITSDSWIGGPVQEGTPIRLTVRGVGANGPLGSYERTQQLQAGYDAEFFTFTGVPPGPVVVIAERLTPQQTWQALARMEGEIPYDSFGETIAIDLAQSAPAAGLPYVMSGANNWRHSVDLGGNLSAGVKFENNQLRYGNSFTSASQLSINGSYVWDARALSPTASPFGTHALLGPFPTLTPAYVTRQVFVPTDGSFLRYYDVIANDTNIPITIRADHRTFSTTDNVRDLSAPNQTDPGVLVYDQPQNNRASLGLVFGSNEPPFASELLFDNGASTAPIMRTTYTIPAHSKIALLHFVVLRDPNDADGVSGKAFDLGFVSDWDAMFAGLSDEERALIINFRQ